MEDLAQALINSRNAFSALVDQKLALLQRLEEQQNRYNKLMEENLAKVKPKIKLDIGGKIFTTSKTTLLSQEGSLFHILLSSGCWEPGTDDRNPKHFGEILDYLRGDVAWGKPDQSDAASEKLQDLQYFRISIPQWNTATRGSDPTSQYNENQIKLTFRNNNVKDLCSEFIKWKDSLLQVEKKIATLQFLEEERKLNAKLIEEHIIRSKDKIKLDIGGTIFATSRATLLSHKDSYFHAMLSSGRWQPDEDGVYFIDRNPKGFDNILDFLRRGKFSWEGLDTDKLGKDLDYFQICIPSFHSNNENQELMNRIEMETGKFHDADVGNYLEVKKQVKRFDYLFDFDKNGLLYWIGASENSWINPLVSSQVALTTSHTGNMKLEDIIARNGGTSCYWGGSCPQYFILDLKQRRLRCNYFTLRHGYHATNSYIQNWTFSCSNDLTHWTTLYEGSETPFNKAFDTKSWPVQDAKEFCRYFKIVQKGNYSMGRGITGGGTAYLCISGFEIYGDLLLD